MSALSVTIRLVGASPDNSDLVFTVNRDPNRTDAYTADYVSPTKAKTGLCALIINFFAQPDGAGALVATAQVNVTIGEGGVVTGGGGTSSGPPAPLTVSVSSVVATVEVASPQSVSVGERIELAFVARDAQNNVVAVSPGSAVFAIASGADRLRVAGGHAQGLAPGEATVTATVDGVTSAPQRVGVISPAPPTPPISMVVSPQAVTLSVGARHLFAASVTGTADTQTVWSVQEGEAGGTITTNGLYTAPGVPGTFHVVATSTVDNHKKAVASVTVQAGNLSAIVE